MILSPKRIENNAHEKTLEGGGVNKVYYRIVKTVNRQFHDLAAFEKFAFICSMNSLFLFDRR